MSPSEFLSALWPTLVDFARKFWRWCTVHGRSLRYAASIAVVIWLALFWYQSRFRDEIVILTAARGSSSSLSVDRLASAIRATERVPGVNYTVRTETTHGAIEIERRLRGDVKGNVIAYYLNEKDPPGEIKLLLPLDYDYLHILCRADFAAQKFPKDFSYQFRDVFPKITGQRVFAGPPGSEARRLAECIAVRYGRQRDELENFVNPAIDDWVEARAGLKMGTLDLVFFMGPFDTDTIKAIADDRSAVMLGLEDSYEALARHEGFSLIPVQFPHSSYSAARWDVPTRQFLPELSRKLTLEFCPRDLTTLATRRLIACSSAMQASDASQLAFAAYTALASDSPEIGDLNAEPPGVIGKPVLDKMIPPHAGAVLSRKPDPPSVLWSPASWSPTFVSGISGIILFLLSKLGESVRSSASRTEEPAGAIEAPATAPATQGLYALLHQDLEDWIHLLERHEGIIKPAEWSRMKDDIHERHQQVRAGLHAGSLSETEAEVLFQGIRNIQVELDLLEPKSKSAGSHN
jgi:hypothetical protein